MSKPGSLKDSSSPPSLGLEIPANPADMEITIEEGPRLKSKITDQEFQNFLNACREDDLDAVKKYLADFAFPKAARGKIKSELMHGSQRLMSSEIFIALAESLAREDELVSSIQGLSANDKFDEIILAEAAKAVSLGSEKGLHACFILSHLKNQERLKDFVFHYGKDFFGQTFPSKKNDIQFRYQAIGTIVDLFSDDFERVVGAVKSDMGQQLFAMKEFQKFFFITALDSRPVDPQALSYLFERERKSDNEMSAGEVKEAQASASSRVELTDRERSVLIYNRSGDIDDMREYLSRQPDQLPIGIDQIVSGEMTSNTSSKNPAMFDELLNFLVTRGEEVAMVFKESERRDQVILRQAQKEIGFYDERRKQPRALPPIGLLLSRLSDPEKLKIFLSRFDGEQLLDMIVPSKSNDDGFKLRAIKTFTDLYSCLFFPPIFFI